MTRPIARAGRLAPVALALALAGACTGALAADATPRTDPAVLQKLELLMQRVQQLEQRNGELERQVRELGARQPASAAAPASDWGKPREERLVALEQQVKSLARPPVEDEEEAGPEFATSLVALAQRVGADGAGTGRSQGRLNYRGDIEVGLPLGTLPRLGDAKLSGFGHLRFGQGGGVSLRPTHTATVNSIPFEGAAGSADSYLIVAQAFGQLEWSLDAGQFNDLASNRLELTLGKIDLFGFFDQNAVAGDEGAQFLNNVFVHNPLLDSGGDIAGDAYGFMPGLRVAYIDEGIDRGWGFGASLGLFASGSGADFNGGPRRPLVIGQLEFAPKQINGEPRGTYRLYAWTNGQTTNLAGNAPQRHSGYGLSVDQKIGRDWNLFGRWGHRTSGEGTFDKALTLGFEHGGRAWGRGPDAVGVAAAWLRTSGEWARATALDPDLAGYPASGNEQVIEAYYRWKLSDRLELTPDLQWIRRAGGDGGAPSFTAVGLRAALAF